MRRFVLVSLLCLGLAAGCTQVGTWHNDFVHRYQAERGWIMYRAQSGDRQDRDFAHGWKQGYYETACGGDGTPPPVPPEKYWAPFYRTVAGHAQVESWYEGYQFGSIAAEQAGVAITAYIPTAPDLAGPPPAWQQPGAPMDPEVVSPTPAAEPVLPEPQGATRRGATPARTALLAPPPPPLVRKPTRGRWPTAAAEQAKAAPAGKPETQQPTIAARISAPKAPRVAQPLAESASAPEDESPVIAAEPVVDERPTIVARPPADDRPAVADPPAIVVAPLAEEHPAERETSEIAVERQDASAPAFADEPSVAAKEPATEIATPAAQEPKVAEVPPAREIPPVADKPAIIVAPAADDKPAPAEIARQNSPTAAPPIIDEPVSAEKPTIDDKPENIESPKIAEKPVVPEPQAVVPKREAVPASARLRRADVLMREKRLLAAPLEAAAAPRAPGFASAQLLARKPEAELQSFSADTVSAARVKQGSEQQSHRAVLIDEPPASPKTTLRLLHTWIPSQGASAVAGVEKAPRLVLRVPAGTADGSAAAGSKGEGSPDELRFR